MAKIRFGIDRVPGDRSPAVSDWKLAALAFFDPKFATSKEIVDVLNLLDEFSGEHIDIFLHGYRENPPDWIYPQDVVQLHVGHRTMYYDPKLLLSDVEKLQSQTCWHFSMEIDVIILKQRLHYFGNVGYERDFEKAITTNLYRLLKDNKISSYVSFFSEIIQFAKDYEGTDPAWDFSDHKLWKELKRSLFESFKAYLGFRKFQIKVEDYAVQNIRKK